MILVLYYNVYHDFLYDSHTQHILSLYTTREIFLEPHLYIFGHIHDS